MDPHDALRHYFAFPGFRPGQEAALGHVLAGRDTLVVMPTGSGKSLIYQLAALLLPGTALVISPLVALMKDQIDGLARRGILATFVNSSLDQAEQSRRLRALAEGQYKIVLVAPERLRSRPFRDALRRVPLSLLAVDEAHCLSQWGHDFRPDYLRIAEARADFKAPVTLALTATATPRVQEDIIRLLGLPGAERIVTGFNRPNLTLEVFSAPDVTAKLNLVRDFVTAAEGAGIIYAGTRRDAEEVADFVRDVAGLQARHYHGALDDETRAEVQDAFMAGDLPVVVATNAFGMGIDRPDVRFVLHYTMPGTIEAYYQEAGRAGRDGLPARAALLYSPKDTALHEFFIENDSPSADDLRAVHAFLSHSPETRLDEIERATGLSDTKARVALEQLEVARAVRRLPDEAASLVRVETLPLVESELRAVAAQVAARREHKYRQLEKMVDYAETNACRRRTILDHFGDAGSADASICCDNCLARAETAEAQAAPAEAGTGSVAALTQPERGALIVLDAIAHLKWQVGRSKLAQLLKGSTAQDMRLYAQARNYGKLTGLRLAEIESLIGQLIDAGHIKQAGSKLPTLKLTPKGEAALKTHAAIAVNLRRVQPGAARKHRAEREAGGTVALTGQLLAGGRSPEQIAAERGLSVGTIYSHLARLIAEGRASVDAVVPAELQKQIRAAIEAVGSAEYLAPIKARLPEEIDYGVIRCVANAWLIERGQSLPASARKVTPISEPEDPRLFERLRVWRLEKSRAIQKPSYTIFSDETLHGIAAHRPKSLTDLLTIRGIGPSKVEKYGAEVLALVAEAERSEPIAQPSHQHTDDSVAAFLARPHPRSLKGPWRVGWALSFHSRFDGDRQIRSAVGEMAFRYKYNGERHLARDLAARWVELLAAHPELPKPDAVIPIPPSTRRDFDPVTLLARVLAEQLGVPALADALAKTRSTKPQKEMTALAQKQSNVAGAFALKGDVRGKRLILVDDLYDSGATLTEAARVLSRGGAASLVVLTLTKTIHADA